MLVHDIIRKSIWLNKHIKIDNKVVVFIICTTVGQSTISDTLKQDSLLLIYKEICKIYTYEFQPMFYISHH